MYVEQMAFTCGEDYLWGKKGQCLVVKNYSAFLVYTVLTNLFLFAILFSFLFTGIVAQKLF